MSDPLEAIRPKSKEELHKVINSVPPNPADIIAKMNKFNELNVECLELCKKNVAARGKYELDLIKNPNAIITREMTHRFESLSEMCVPMCSRSIMEETKLFG